MISYRVIQLLSGAFGCRVPQMSPFLRFSIIEPQRQKTYLGTRAPSEDSDQPSLGPFLTTKDARFLHVNNEDSDQTSRMRRLT